MPLTSVQRLKKPLRAKQRRHLWGITILALALVLGLTFFSNRTVGTTEAFWTSSVGASSSFDAGTVPPPEITSCRIGGTPLLNPQAVITWSVPSELQDDFDLSQVKIYAQRGLLGDLIDLSDRNYDIEDNTTGGPTQFTTRVSSSLLQGLLLGSGRIRMSTQINSWESPTPATVDVSFGLGGLLGGCSVPS